MYVLICPWSQSMYKKVFNMVKKKKIKEEIEMLCYLAFIAKKMIF